ncbi:hypothetical protein GCM10023350_08830 [Nocardioides endophyticus]|uniref:Uncharacterized protein n=1 Tax=Nocardioides endophyticus TaxID=1353775 RepID=A0ABP8YGM6_9ACTN
MNGSGTVGGLGRPVGMSDDTGRADGKEGLRLTGVEELAKRWWFWLRKLVDRALSGSRT